MQVVAPGGRCGMHARPRPDPLQLGHRVGGVLRLSRSASAAAPAASACASAFATCAQNGGRVAPTLSYWCFSPALSMKALTDMKAGSLCTNAHEQGLMRIGPVHRHASLPIGWLPSSALGLLQHGLAACLACGPGSMHHGGTGLCMKLPRFPAAACTQQSVPPCRLHICAPMRPPLVPM